MTSSPLHTVPRDRLLRLVEDYEFKPYRHYRTHTRKEQAAILAAEIDEALAAGSFGQWVTRDGEDAAVVGRALPWDSQFFGVAMGRLDYVLAGPAATVEHLEAAVGRHASPRRAPRACSTWRRGSTSPTCARWACSRRAGFRTMDALVTYIMRPRKDPHPDVRVVGTIRDATPAGHRGDRRHHRGGLSRLSRPLPPRSAPVVGPRRRPLPRMGAGRAPTAPMADTVIVAEDAAGEVSGYLAYRRREPVSSLGTPVFGGGLGAVRRDSPGAYTGLIQAGSMRAHAAGAVSECQTQNYNFAVIRVYEAAGFHYVRAEYTLHAWLG